MFLWSLHKMSVFYCSRTERNIFLFKRRAWTCIYNVGPRSRTVVLGYEVEHYILETNGGACAVARC